MTKFLFLYGLWLIVRFGLSVHLFEPEHKNTFHDCFNQNFYKLRITKLKIYRVMIPEEQGGYLDHRPE